MLSQKHNQSRLLFILVILAFFTLSACGGGGTNDTATLTKPKMNTASHDIFIPESVSTDLLTGDVDGAMLYIGADAVSDSAASKPSLKISSRATLSVRDAAGFVIQRPAMQGEANAAEVLNSMQTVLSSQYPAFSSTGRQNLPSQSGVLAKFNLNTFSNIQPTDLAAQILDLIGANITGGIISNLPTSLASEPFADTFTVEIGVIYFSADDVVILLSVVSNELAESYAAVTSTLTDGTIVSPTIGGEQRNKTDPFLMPASSGKADFLFVIDNSRSMSDEQTAISEAATEFINAITQSGLDYEMGTITTDNATLRDSNFDGGFTRDVNEFQLDVKPGIGGSGTETGIWFAEQVLFSEMEGDAEDGTVSIAGYPRENASMNIVIMSDEPSQYESRSAFGTAFDVTSNLFINRDYTVHAIIDPIFNDLSQYDDLALATGGSTADITDTSTFPVIMSNIAKQAGGASSVFVLSNAPISSTIKVSVQGVTIVNSSTNGWEYNVANNSILFNGSAVPTEGQSIVVSYEYFVITSTEAG